MLLVITAQINLVLTVVAADLAQAAEASHTYSSSNNCSYMSGGAGGMFGGGGGAGQYAQGGPGGAAAGGGSSGYDAHSNSEKNHGWGGDGVIFIQYRIII